MRQREAALTIRMIRYGCTNRPFFRIVASHVKKGRYAPPLEQLGSFDPIPNENNEKMVGLNFKRLRWWIGAGAEITKPVQQLLGMYMLINIYYASEVPCVC